MRRPAIAAIVALGALVFTGSAQACSCAQIKPARAMRQADAAIDGRLLEVIPRGRASADYRYRVQRVYKRARGIRRGRVIAVRSARESSACGLPRRTGRRYGLLLRRHKRRWTSGLCGMLKPGALAGESRRLFDCAS